MKNILIVDDEFLIRYSLSHMLESASTRVIAASTGTDALREISKSSFDLCCLDIHLPDMNGMDIMRKIRRLTPDTGIIMMTGGEISGDMLKEIWSNSELLLSKPFDLFKVKSFVDRILASGSPAQGRRGMFANRMTLDYSLMNDQRKHERRPMAGQVTVTKMSVRGEGELSAEIIDISENGMCLVTTCLMHRGLVLRIRNDTTERCTGTVRWSMRLGDRDLFRTGIELA